MPTTPKALRAWIVPGQEGSSLSLHPGPPKQEEDRDGEGVEDGKTRWRKGREALELGKTWPYSLGVLLLLRRKETN